MTAPFQVPRGNPERVRAEARRLGQLGTDLGKASNDVQTEAGKALNGWTGPRAAMYAVASGGTFLALELTGATLGATSAALKKYAKALEKTQREIGGYVKSYQENEQRLARELPTGDRNHLVRQQSTYLPKMAGLAGDEMKGPAAEAATALQSLGALRPEKSDPSARGFFEYISRKSLVANAGATYMEFKKFSDPVLTAYSLLDAGDKGIKVLRAIRAGRLASEAQANLSRHESRRALITQLYLDGGLGNMSRSQLQAWVTRTAREIENATGKLAMRQAAHQRALARNATPLGGARGVKLARVVGVLGLLGVVDVVKPEHTGWRGWGDRVSGGASVISASIYVAGFAAGTVGAVAASPVVVAVGVTLGISSALWAGGNWSYDNYKNFDDWGKQAGGWLKHNTIDVPQRVFDGMRQSFNPMRYVR